MLARLASQVKTLEHYIWSTLPNGERLTEGRIPVPHFDYKARVDDYIKETLPELAAKTTFLMFGFYPTNFAFFPMLKPVPVVIRPPTLENTVSTRLTKLCVEHFSRKICLDDSSSSFHSLSHGW